MSKPAKTILYMFLFVIAIAISVMFLPSNPAIFGGTMPTRIDLSKFGQLVRAKQVNDIEWQETTITGHLTAGDEGRFEVNPAPEASSAAGAYLMKEMDDAGINYKLRSAPLQPKLMGILSVILLPLLVIAIIYFLVLKPASRR